MIYEQPGVFVPLTICVLSSHAGLFRERVAGDSQTVAGDIKMEAQGVT